MQAPIFSEEIPQLLQTHLEHLRQGSGIITDVIIERGYRSVIDGSELIELGFAAYQCRVPGLLIPIWGVDGQVVSYQYKPDYPRVKKKGKKIKYETPKGASNRIDCPPRCQILLADPSVSLWITEGTKKADCLASLGECVIDITGIWNWRGRNRYGGTTVLPDFDSIALNGRPVNLAPDSDVATNPAVKQGATRLGAFLIRRKAKVVLIFQHPLADGAKCGVDDFIVAGHTLDELKALAVGIGDTGGEGEKEIYRNYFLLNNQLYLEVRKYDADYSFAYLEQGKTKFTPEVLAERQTIRPRPLPQLEGKAISIVAMPDEGMAQSQLLTASDLYGKIKTHLASYIDLLPLDLELCVYYILFTWFYQKVDTLGYLRFLADTGKGKSRAQKVVGDVCFYPVFASGASSFSGTARLNNRWHGTLIIDEADIGGDKEHQFIKYLNLGFERGKYYVLSDKQNPKFQEYFEPFSPKVLAMRQHFRDNATEGRLLSVSLHETSDTSIPIILPPSYLIETQQLRNEIALFTLHNWNKVDGGKMLSFTDLQIEPRLKQLAMPLSIVFQLWPEGGDKFKTYLKKRQIEIKKTRALSWEGSLVNLVITISTGDLSLQEEFADYYLPNKKTIQAVTPTMVAKQMKTSTKAATQGLQSVGFEVEWRWLILNRLGIESKKRTRAYCVPDFKTWDEIIQRYYFADDEKNLELPEVLRSSKYTSGVQETVPSVPSVPVTVGSKAFGTDGTVGTLPNTQEMESKTNGSNTFQSEFDVPEADGVEEWEDL